MKKTNTHAKQLSKLGASLGGKARAMSMTAEQRSRNARNAVIVRWAKAKSIPESMVGKTENTLLKAINQGDLKIQSITIPCYVLEDGTRVVSGRGLQNAMGYSSKASGVALTKEFDKLGNKKINKIIDKKVEFKRPGAGGSADRTFGYQADVLVDICDILLDLRKQGNLTNAQEKLAQQAEILTRAFAKVGVIALIDEATGYQKQKDAYQKLLEQYLAPEIRPWIRTFDDDYYKQLYRLIGWDWNAFKAKKKNHSRYIGKLTNRIVYEKLAPGILEALDEINPKNAKGNRSHRHHQHLSENIGYVKLIKHVSAVTVIMEQYEDGQIIEALHKIDTRYPSFKIDYQPGFDFPIQMDKSELKEKN